MFKSFLTIFLWASIFLFGGTLGWSGEDMEDRFVNPDLDTSKTIFLDIKDVSLINVLKIISKQTGLSFIASHDVQDKKITLYLNKVPLNQALQMILDANDLTYEMQDDTNVFVVIPKFQTEKTKITKVYQLKYATVSSSKLNSTLSAGGSSSSGGGGLQGVLKDSLSKDGKVVEDARTNSLIITDVPGQFDIIEKTIARLDVPIPQILIEVEMLDVSKSTGDKLGISYGSTPFAFTGGGSKSTGWPFGPGGSSGSGSSTTSSSSSGGGSITAAGMSATLSFIATVTDARVLARPRILTLNNQTAQIEISTNQAISISQLSSSTSGNNSQISYTPERYTTGVILKVTPQANLLTREVTMAVSPKVIDVILSKVQPPSGSSQGQIFDPETRGSDSILKIKDGQTMVIGGLMHNEVNKTVSKLPFLGDLPLIGAAFRYIDTEKAERELIIFLTPHIIDEPDQSAFKREGSSISAQAALDIQDAEDRIHEMNNSLNIYDMNKS